MQNNVVKRKREQHRDFAIKSVQLHVRRLTAAGGWQLVAPIGAVPLAVTEPAFWNAGIRAGAAEQSWSTSHWAWKEGRRWKQTQIRSAPKENKNHWDEPLQKLFTLGSHPVIAETPPTPPIRPHPPTPIPAHPSQTKSSLIPPLCTQSGRRDASGLLFSQKQLFTWTRRGPLSRNSLEGAGDQ